jgi:hypothetical protein
MAQSSDETAQQIVIALLSRLESVSIEKLKKEPTEIAEAIATIFYRVRQEVRKQ